MDIHLIFRKKAPEFFSMENVFSILLPIFRQKATVRIINAPERSATPVSVMKNLLAFRKVKTDIAHITGDIHYAVFAFRPGKVVLTIHDCVLLHKTTGLKKFILVWFWHKLPVRYARFVTTISEATKKDIIKITHCKPEKVKVIRNPVDPAFIQVNKVFDEEQPVILQMGTWPNKNLELVVQSIVDIPCKLFIVGKLSEVQQLLLDSKGIDYENRFNLSKEELIAAYAAADLLVFASTFEGFGLPIIEAQATGIPVITSAIDPMREVAGKGAHLVDPFSVKSIAEGIRKVIGDSTYRKALVEHGNENLRRFTRETIAAQYTELYNEIMQGEVREGVSVKVR